MNEPVSNSLKIEILNETKNVLTCPKIKNNQCISLYEIIQLIRNTNAEYKKLKKKYEYHFDSLLKTHIDNSSYAFVYDFDYQKKVLSIGFKKYKGSEIQSLHFKKIDGDLCIAESDISCAREVFQLLSSSLSNLYDELLKYEDFRNYKKGKYNVKPINSNFDINICGYGIHVEYKDDFILRAPGDENGYSLTCNSGNVVEVIKGKEDDIFKNIYIKISDCPEWSQAMLFEIRQKELEVEEKKEKRLELKRKFLPFLKK